jgi:hypothetical protein
MSEIRITSMGTDSIRTSQSSSIHTDDLNEHDYRRGTTERPVLQVVSSRPSDLTSLRSSLPPTPLNHSDLMGRSSSLISHMEDPPTIITPTTTYYHFSTGRSVPVKRCSESRYAKPRPSDDELVYVHSQTPFTPADRPIQPAPPSHNVHQHARDESLPPLLPYRAHGLDFTVRAISSPDDERARQERMKGVSWAKRERTTVKVDEEYISGIQSGREPQSPPTRQIILERVKDMEEGVRGMQLMGPSGTAGDRGSRNSVKTKRGSLAREQARGGWI